MVDSHLGAAAALASRRRVLEQQWSALLKEIRASAQPSFLRPPKATDLLQAAQDGPVVIVNASRLSCDALLVTPERIWRLPLPSLTFDDTVAYADRYLIARQIYDRVAAAAFSSDATAQGEVQAAKVSMEQAIVSTQEWLWEYIAEPVLRALGFADAPEPARAWPRIWWCPTGPLALLPLHAAGYHEPDPGRGSPQTVVDRVVSSYTPTLRALIESRKRTAPAEPDDGGSAQGEMLIVAVEEAPGMPRLPNVGRERDLLRSKFANRHVLLDGPRASCARVAEALAVHSWVHLSCHGQQDLANPTRGRIELFDGSLSITELIRVRHRGQFAFLSACKTGVGSVSLSEEAITLATTLHYTGFRHVVATLWSVWDDAAADLAAEFYNTLMPDSHFDPDGSAYALNVAVRTLRDKDGNRFSPSSWTPFIHIGP